MTTTLAEVLRIPQVPPVSSGEVRRIAVPGRGRMRCRIIGEPGGSTPTLLVLHGWTATADVNFATVFGPLAECFPVVAPDLRGHGGGIRGSAPFTLEACAEDMAGLLDTLGTGPTIALGYSLGGPIALLLARRHPQLISGLVLCATAARLGRSSAGRLALGALGAFGLATHSAVYQVARSGKIPREIIRRLPTPLGHDLAQVAEVGGELARFDARPWLGEITQPAVVVVTRRDHAVPAIDQEMLATGLADCRVFEVDGDHDICLSPNPVYESTICAAAGDVASRCGCEALRYGSGAEGGSAS